MTDFDIHQFEDRIEDLLAAYRKQRSANETLVRELKSLTQKNAELKERLTAVIERIRALEEEAEAQNA